MQNVTLKPLNTVASSQLIRPTQVSAQVSAKLSEPVSSTLVVTNTGATANPYSIESGTVHLRIQKRTGKKCLTFIQGIPDTIDVKSLCQKIRKMYHCNCTEIDHPKIGKCVQMSGDSRDDLIQFLIKEKVVPSEKEIKLHGF